MQAGSSRHRGVKCYPQPRTLRNQRTLRTLRPIGRTLLPCPHPPRTLLLLRTLPPHTLHTLRQHPPHPSHPPHSAPLPAYQVPDCPCCSRRCSSCKCSSTCSWHASPRQCRGQHLPQVGAVRWEPAPTMNLHRGATTTASTLHPIVRHHTVRAPPGQPRHRRRPRRRR